MSKQKRKGDEFERQLARHINERLGQHVCERAPLSGGGVVGQMSGGADLLGPPDLFVEAKRVESLSFPAAMRQADTNAAKQNTPDTPVVINRRSRQSVGESYVLLHLDHFLRFYAAHLARIGVLNEEELQAALARLQSQS